MNQEMAAKFVNALAECAVTGDSASWRKEAAANQLAKNAFNPAFVYGPAAGALLGATAGYFSDKDEKKKLRNLLYGAGIGGLSGLAVPALINAGNQFTAKDTLTAGVDSTNPAVQAAVESSGGAVPGGPNGGNGRRLYNHIPGAAGDAYHAGVAVGGGGIGFGVGHRAVTNWQNRRPNELLRIARELQGLRTNDGVTWRSRPNADARDVGLALEQAAQAVRNRKDPLVAFGVRQSGGGRVKTGPGHHSDVVFEQTEPDDMPKKQVIENRFTRARDFFMGIFGRNRGSLAPAERQGWLERWRLRGPTNDAAAVDELNTVLRTLEQQRAAARVAAGGKVNEKLPPLNVNSFDPAAVIRATRTRPRVPFGRTGRTLGGALGALLSGSAAHFGGNAARAALDQNTPRGRQNAEQSGAAQIVTIPEQLRAAIESLSR